MTDECVAILKVVEVLRQNCRACEGGGYVHGVICPRCHNGDGYEPISRIGLIEELRRIAEEVAMLYEDIARLNSDLERANRP